MSKTLDQFVEEVKATVDAFAEDYRKEAETNENYPLELDEGNAGVWWEFLFDYKGEQK